MKKRLFSLLLAAVLILAMMPSGVLATESQDLYYYTVTYKWKVYNTDGTFTDLPAGAPHEPATTGGHAEGELYAYDHEYVVGTSFYDYEKGLLYSFHGWDTYSRSSVFNIDPTAVGYNALDDEDVDASNNKRIEITGDTYIYGYWTVSELAPASAHLSIEKKFIVDGVEMTMKQAEDLWFRIDTGIDRDNDGDTEIDVDYPMIKAANGEYKIPVYQYDTPFVFTEYNAEVPGYTRTTTVTVSGDYITGYTQNGDSVTVSMDAVYQGENVHLGTVTYINTYTKITGNELWVYPTLTLMKTAANTGAGQDGVVFTLYRDEACTDAVTTVTTANGGEGVLDFMNMAPGVYYLKEITPAADYKLDPSVYILTLTASDPVEELRGNEYITVIRHSLSVKIPENSAATYEATTLYISNDPYVGKLNVDITTAGLAEADKSALNAVVIVHGPITRNEQEITDIGGTWELNLNPDNNWSAALSDLPVGEYLIHESFASVHGYTWTNVTYGSLETVVYNGIRSGVITVEADTAASLTLSNTYEVWDTADFYIKKVDENGNALAGAVYQLYCAMCDEPHPLSMARLTTGAVTGADGYAYFGGFAVPDGMDSYSFYLMETKAPDGYYLNDTVYKVTIHRIRINGTTYFEPEITLMSGGNANFDAATDLLTIPFSPVLSQLTVTKDFTEGEVPEDLLGVIVLVTGPDGYEETVDLDATNNWSVTLENLKLGTYTVTEMIAASPGYKLEVFYKVGDTVTIANAEVTLSEPVPGKTTPDTLISGEATILNRYLRHEYTYEIATALTVMAVDEDGAPLSGVTLSLERMDPAGGGIMSTTTFTSGSEGKLLFDLLSGLITEDEIIDGTYILSMTAVPDGYEAQTTKWTVTVSEDDGELRVVLDKYKNVFENIWDWIIGGITAETSDNWTWDENVLTVQCVKKTAPPPPTTQPTAPPTTTPPTTAPTTPPTTTPPTTTQPTTPPTTITPSTTPPPASTPTTGDVTNLMGLYLTLLCSGIAISALLAYKRRENRQ